MNKIAFILEGGGMRGHYTSGILDVMMENDIYLKNIYAVSAGLCNALNYRSHQIGRGIEINNRFLNDKRYIGKRNFIKSGQFINLEWLFHEISDSIIPFDVEAFNKNNDIKITTVLSEINSDKPFYKVIDDYENEKDYCIGACSIPVLSKIIKIGDKGYLDGGAVDAIPIEKAIEDGFTKFVIILTRPKGYYKDEKVINSILKNHYRKYPKMVKLFGEKDDKYNRSLKIISDLEEKGDCFAIYPKEPLKVSKVERNVHKIKEIYNIGRTDASDLLESLKQFIKKSEEQ